MWIGVGNVERNCNVYLSAPPYLLLFAVRVKQRGGLLLGVHLDHLGVVPHARVGPLHLDVLACGGGDACVFMCAAALAWDERAIWGWRINVIRECPFREGPARCSGLCSGMAQCSREGAGGGEHSPLKSELNSLMVTSRRRGSHSCAAERRENNDELLQGKPRVGVSQQDEIGAKAGDTGGQEGAPGAGQPAGSHAPP